MKNNWSKQISLPFGLWKTLEEERKKFVIKISQIKLFDFAKLEKMLSISIFTCPKSKRIGKANKILFR